MTRLGSMLFIVGVLAAACAESGPSHHHHAKSPDEVSHEEPAVKHEAPRSDTDEAKAESAEPAEKPTQQASEPEFTEGMSVDDAIKAVPPGIERRNIDQETLGKPLQDVSVYEPCKPGSARVKLRVAIWDGRAVGIDVSTTPKNDKLSACVRERISALKWDKKVKSLNTIEYQL